MHLSAGSRSKTLPPGSMSQKLTNINLDRLKNAKLTAEKAMKVRDMAVTQNCPNWRYIHGEVVGSWKQTKQLTETYKEYRI